MNVWAPDAPLPGFFGQTVREVARVSLGGKRLGLRLTNEHGTAPIKVEAVEVALAAEGGRVEPLTTRTVTFGGRRDVTIYPGAPVLSDPVELPLDSLARVAVSYYSPGFIPVATHHFEAQQTTFVSVPGNFAAAEAMIVQRTTTSRYLMSAILVEANASARAVVCFGDSITDGYGSSIDTDRRWPDILAERLLREAATQDVSVLNQGIGGNRILHNRRGAKALERFDRDVLSVGGVSHLVVLEGINDIVWPNTVLADSSEAVTAVEIIGGLDQMLVRAKLAGLKVILATITPFEGTEPDFPDGGYYTAEKERVRQAVNRWIRSESGAHGIVDFDAVLRDPARPIRLLPAFDSGDHIHPGDAGYRAMANAIDLSLLA